MAKKHKFQSLDPVITAAVEAVWPLALAAKRGETLVDQELEHRSGLTKGGPKWNGFINRLKARILKERGIECYGQHTKEVPIKGGAGERIHGVRLYTVKEQNESSAIHRRRKKMSQHRRSRRTVAAIPVGEMTKRDRANQLSQLETLDRERRQTMQAAGFMRSVFGGTKTEPK